jgi:hypothetical protein
MIRIQRLLYYILILAFFAFISITIFPHLKTGPSSLPSTNTDSQESTSQLQKPKKADPDSEKYLSWFPHR